MPPAKFWTVPESAITKAVLPFFPVANNAFDGTSDNLRMTIRKGSRHSADETGCPLLVRHPFKASDQSRILYMVGSIFAHISCGIDSRFPAQVIDLKS